MLFVLTVSCLPKRVSCLINLVNFPHFLGARCSFVVRAVAHGAILHGVAPLSYFLFQPGLHDWCNKGRGMCYPVCGMVHIKEPLVLIGKSSLCGGSGFPISLSEWSFTICPTPYNRKLKKCVECVVSFLPSFTQLALNVHVKLFELT